ncbi:hypothetical protein GCM10028819_27320 [Spirosoma humi]
MSRAINEPQKLDLPRGQNAINKVDFHALYDRYAPALFGVITKSILNKDEAAALLEKIFVAVGAEIGLFEPEKQPVFAWLLTITRNAITDALQMRNRVPYPAFQVTTTGQVTLPAHQPAPAVHFDTHPTNSQLKELLDAVLFKKCTPEEAARTMGLPTETARQQLRLAMQQLRS